MSTNWGSAKLLIGKRLAPEKLGAELFETAVAAFYLCVRMMSAGGSKKDRDHNFRSQIQSCNASVALTGNSLGTEYCREIDGLHLCYDMKNKILTRSTSSS